MAILSSKEYKNNGRLQWNMTFHFLGHFLSLYNEEMERSFVSYMSSSIHYDPLVSIFTIWLSMSAYLRGLLHLEPLKENLKGLQQSFRLEKEVKDAGSYHSWVIRRVIKWRKGIWNFFFLGHTFRGNICNPMGLESKMPCVQNASCHVRDDKVFRSWGKYSKMLCS